MFSAESAWGQTRPLARNRLDPAQTMIKSLQDKVLAQHTQRHLESDFLAEHFKIDFELPRHWAPEEFVLDSANLERRCGDSFSTRSHLVGIQGCMSCMQALGTALSWSRSF
jgi:hypothetical protein